MNETCEMMRERILRRIDGGPDGSGISLDGHLEGCAPCREFQRALQDDHQQLAGHAASMDDAVARIEGHVIEQLANGTDATDQEGLATVIPLGRRIMNMILTRYGAAAAVLLAVMAGFGVLSQMNDTGVAWADVLEQVKTVNSYSYKIVSNKGGSSREIRTCFSADHGTVTDMYRGDKLVERTFYDRDEQELVSLMPDEKVYTRRKISEAGYRELNNSENPAYLLEQMISRGHKDLGRSEIDGVEVVGVEADIPGRGILPMDPFSIRLWADAKTHWPVRIEFFRLGDDGERILTSTHTEFRWNADIDPEELTLEIPADYRTLFDRGDLSLDESHAIEGLRLFLKHTGRYPQHLARVGSKELMYKYINGMLAVVDLSADSPDLTEADVMEAMRPYREWKEFLHQLRKEQRDVAWHGNEIIPGAAESILWRWRLDDGNYRVIYGDLTAKTVSPDVLDLLEST